MDVPDSSPWQRPLPSWLPFLWSRVLFPGESPTAVDPWRGRSLALLILLPALLLYPCLSFHLLEPDESRYAEIPREMLQRGELLVPYLEGQPYLDKPPLLYWLVMACYRVFGVHDWAARLPPALAVHGCILLAYFFGRRSFSERAAFWGALLLGLAPGFMSMGRLLLLDGLLAFCTTLAMFSAFEALRGHRLKWGWWLLSAAACGLGVLTKGPVALLLLAPPIAMHRWLVGSQFKIANVAYGVYLLVLLIVTVPWYAALCVRIPEFGRYFFWEQNVQRFLMPFAHEQGVWYYAPVLLGGLLPGTALLWPFGRFLLARDETTVRLRSPELGFMLLACGWCIAFFTVSSCKLPTYILPAFPPLCLALGHFLAHGPWGQSAWPRRVAGVAFGVLLTTHHAIVPWYAEYRSPLSRPDEVRRLCSDPATPVVCYPRTCDSVAFYLGRDDLRNYRSKEIEDLRYLVRTNPRTVILCTHRHSLHALQELLPPDVRIVDTVHLGLPDLPGVPANSRKT
ncbi:MAG TPA: glycosyltransferase family 39 protein, partial [Gemmataceae bacterium]|nr:glycosyltransferase family 39 protein [Gemmataceae bacterium]